MKKILALVLFLAMMLSITGCASKADRTVHEETLAGIQAIREDTETRPLFSLPYDNETPAEEAKVLSLEKLQQDYGFISLPPGSMQRMLSASLGASLYEEAIESSGILLRYTYGKYYYSINPVEEGGYFVALYEPIAWEGGGFACLVEKVSYHITCVGDAKQFYRIFREGMAVSRLKKNFPVIYEEDIGQDGSGSVFFLLDDGTQAMVSYDAKGKVVPTRYSQAGDGSIQSTFRLTAPEWSVLAYLTQADLQLICE